MARKSIHVLLIFVLFLAVGLLGAKASALEQITHADCGLVPSFSVVWVGVDAGIFKKMIIFFEPGYLKGMILVTRLVVVTVFP